MDKNKNMKYLVLGSHGQVGSSLVSYLREVGAEVGEIDIVRGEHEDLRYNTSTIEKKIQQSDFIYFLAYDVGGSRYLAKNQKSIQLILNNSRMMDTVFVLLQKYNKKFIFASSQMASMGHSPYGACKLLGEHYTDILGGKTVKFWNVYGVEHDEEKFHVVTDFVKKAFNNKCIDMLTDGEEERQFLFADDCSECLYKLSLCYDTIDNTTPLHITSFTWTKIKDIADIVASFFPGTKIIPGKIKDKVQNGIKNEPKGDILNYWQPKTDMREGIYKIVNNICKK
jgi:nucleoside-diphosphate-sugar epimerase